VAFSQVGSKLQSFLNFVLMQYIKEKDVIREAIRDLKEAQKKAVLSPPPRRQHKESSNRRGLDAPGFAA
jgi:hypothetical protein